MNHRWPLAAHQNYDSWKNCGLPQRVVSPWTRIYHELQLLAAPLKKGQIMVLTYVTIVATNIVDFLIA
jgi:hypothetical protein